MYIYIYINVKEENETERERSRESEIEKVTWQNRGTGWDVPLALDHGFVAQSQIQCRSTWFNAEVQGLFFSALGRPSGVEFEHSGVEYGTLALDFSVGFVFRRWAAHPMPESGVEDPQGTYVPRTMYVRTTYVLRTCLRLVTPCLRLVYALFNTRFRRKSRNLKKYIKITIRKCVQERKIDSNPTH